MKEIVLVIDNVRSAHNVGSMFRTADAAGVTKIYCIGYTPTPLDRFKRPQKDIAKTALGAEQTLPWEHYDHIGDVIQALKHDGVTIVALEQTKNAIDYRTLLHHGDKVALVVGNEVGGISEGTLALCDHHIEIPMRGTKESLNVSVATGIALYALQNEI